MIIKDFLVPKLKVISSQATMLEAQKMMKEHGIRHLPVSDGKQLVGILSDRDIKLATVVGASDQSKTGHIHSHKLVSEYMSSPVLKMSINTEIHKVVKDMIGLKVSCFVIEDDNGKDVGIITTEDMLIILLDLLESKDSFFTKIKSLFQRSASR